MGQIVDDQVWSELDPNAGALSPTQRKRLTAAVSVGAVLAAAGFAVHLSGVVHPRVELDRNAGFGASASTDTKILTREVVLRNAGWTTVRVTGFGKEGPGLHLLTPADLADSAKVLAAKGTQPPFDLHPGQSKTVVVIYHITDCAAVPRDHFPIPVHVDGTMGAQTIDVSLPRTVPGSSMDGAGRAEEEWQRAAADDACYTRP